MLFWITEYTHFQRQALPLKVFRAKLIGNNTTGVDRAGGAGGCSLPGSNEPVSQNENDIAMPRWRRG
jgi:hypothetical protein